MKQKVTKETNGGQYMLGFDRGLRPFFPRPCYPRAKLPRGRIAASARCRWETYVADIFPTGHNDCDDLTGSAGWPPKIGGWPVRWSILFDARYSAPGMDAPRHRFLLVRPCSTKVASIAI